MKKIYILLLFLFVLQCLSLSHNRILVVLDYDEIRNSHSLFFKDLEGITINHILCFRWLLTIFKARGYELTFKLSSDSSFRLEEYGEYLYDHVIIFSPRSMSMNIFAFN